jgi:diadenosine tetraphosphate (Ap4A) HIT family hydrolase
VSACHTCDLLARRDDGSAPLWDCIRRTDSWDVVHASGTSIEGWMVLVVRRHITSVADMTDAEALELGPLIKAVSAALQEAVGCVKTYVVQFAEHPLHPHVHVHVIPRFADQPNELQGPRVFSALGLPDDQCVPEARMNEIAMAIGQQLEASYG